VSGLDDPIGSDLKANGTWRVKESYTTFGSPPSTTVVLENTQTSLNFYSLTTTALTVTNSLVVFQQLPVFSGNLIQDVRLYRGTETQLADPTIEAQRGAGNVPARYGRAAVMLVGLNKSKFGNQVPNFEVQFRERVSMTVAEAIDELMLRQGFERGLWDTSGVSGYFRGLVAEEPIDSKGLLQIVMQAYGVVAQEVDGRVFFLMRDQVPVRVIPSAELAAADESGRQQGRLVRFEDRESRELPTRVELVYNDAERDLAQASVRETHAPTEGANEGRIVRVRTPLSLTEAEAGAMARQIMLDAYAGRYGISTSLPTSQLDLAEGDVWESSLDGQPVRATISRVELGANGLVAIAGKSYQPQIGLVGADEVDSGPTDTASEIPLSLYLDLFAVDLVALNDAQASTVGVAWTILDNGGEGAYGGGALYQQVDAAEYELAQELPPPQSPVGYGVVVSYSNATGGQGRWWDLESTFTVRGVNGWAPSSSTRDAVMGGANRVLVGHEVVGYVQATDNGDGTYTLSELMRSLNGSRTFDSSNPTIVVPVASLEFNDQVPSSAMGSVVSHKAVGTGWSLEQVDAWGMDFAGRSVLPAWVHSIQGHRDASDNIELAWRRQSRRPWPIFSGAASLDLPDPAEQYEVSIYNAFGIEASTSPQIVTATAGADGRVRWTYTAALAATETGLNFGPSVSKRFVIRQVGAYGNSYWGNEVTVPVGVGLAYSDA
jgi:hypothetical protein